MNDLVQRRIIEAAVRTEGPLAPAASVVMVVYRTGGSLRESLRCVLDDPDVGDFVIVDNGSSAQEAAWQDAAACDPRVTLLRGHGNVGFARGANLGAGAAHGRLLVFLNPDAFLQRGCVRALAAAVDAGGRLCLAGARILNVDGREQRGARRGEVTPVTALLSLTRLSQRVPALRRFEIHHEGDPRPIGPMPVPTVSGACFAMRRGAFAEMGGFDIGYFLHVEDVDLCWRVRRAGGAVLFQPEAEVVHLGSTSHTSPIKVEFFKGLGLVRYFIKRAGGPRRLALALALAPFILAASLGRGLMRPRVR